MSEVLAGPIFFAEFVGPGGVGALLPSASYFLPRDGPCGGRNRPFGGCWAADLPAAESRGRRRCAVGQLGRAASAPHRGGRQRSKRHPGATSGRRTGPFSVLGGPWRSQRRPGTRAAGPHVRAGGGQAPQEVAERGARAPFQRALQTAKAVEVTLSSGAGRGERAKRLVPPTAANVSDRRCPLSVLSFFCALSMASAAGPHSTRHRAARAWGVAEGRISGCF